MITLLIIHDRTFLFYFYRFEMADNAFSFMTNKIKFKEDPKFVHLDDVLRILTYTFMHHMDLWIKLTQKFTQNNFTNVYNELNQVDAGKVYNTLMLTQPFDNIGKTDTELSDQEYESVLNSFYSAVKAHKRLSFHVKDINDPQECMWECCHYFFIPVRLNHSSLPKNVQSNSLRKWINVIFTLPFIPQYIRKFEGVVNNVKFLETIYYKFTEDPTKVSKFTNIEADWIYATIARNYNKEHTTQIFIRLFMNVALLCSVEILKKYCPNYRACAAINPDYDGSWINPFDQQHIDHLQELNKLTTLLAIEERAIS